MGKKLIWKQIRKIGNYLRGTCKEVPNALVYLGLDPQEYEICDVEAAIAKMGDVERCSVCDWWFEVWELDAFGYCDDCK